MANNTITPSNSQTVQIIDHDASAFLLVTEGGYITETRSGYDAYLADGGSANITIKGSVISRTGDGVEVTNDHNIVVVSAAGLVSGQAGVLVNGSDNHVVNAGEINGSFSNGVGVVAEGHDCEIRNSGKIQGFYGINSSADDLSVDNSGLISAGANGYAIDTTGTLSLTNSGTIDGDIRIFGYLATFVNTGTIHGGISLYNSLNAFGISNNGTISGSIGASASDDQFDDFLNNFGYVNQINFNHGDDSLFNDAGAVIRYATMGYEAASTNSSDNDTVINRGEIYGLTCGAGDDSVDTSDGEIGRKTTLGDGNDSYLGGQGIDRVDGGTGNDTIDLSNGNDIYYAGNADGKDIVDAGDGTDRYDASAATQAVVVDLSSDTTGGTVSADTISGFEDLTGGAAGDTLTGNDGVNRIDGGMGADKIDGGAGADRLVGGTGADIITGGVGRDIMTGGLVTGSLDSDTFVFRASDSGTTAATRDRITDFTDHGSNTAPFATGADTIDLSAIDANTGTTGDQSFSFNATKGAAFSGSAGSLIWQQYAGYALVSGDTNGDKIADFTIQLNGTHTLFASDFVL